MPKWLFRTCAASAIAGARPRANDIFLREKWTNPKLIDRFSRHHWNCTVI